MSNYFIEMGFPKEFNDTLNLFFTMLEKYNPCLFGGSVRRLFSNEGFENADIDIFLRTSKRSVLSTFDKILKIYSCFNIDVTLSQPDKDYGNVYKFQFPNMKVDVVTNISTLQLEFDVNSLTIDKNGDIKLLREIHFSDRKISSVEVIKRCIERKACILWGTDKKTHYKAKDFISFLERVDKNRKMGNHRT
jgi:hypothetical protein